MIPNDIKYYADNQQRFLKEWRDLLAFKSISADSSYAQDCDACAKWVSSHIEGLGFKTELWESGGRPVVFGERFGNPDKPALIFYGHYDVQPVDPLELWTSDPFKAEVRDGRMYARGAQDNKGQLFYVLKALESVLADKADLPTIKILIEGEEESGSTALSKMLQERAERLKAKILLVCDTGMVKPGVPTITMGLRGVTGLEFQLFGPRVDIHSGVFGGVVMNPLQALAQILAKLHAPDGSVAVPGFYDGVKEPNAEEKRLVNDSPIDLNRTAEQLGVGLVGGEKRFSPLERRGLRPTIEINGAGGGYQGKGGKTVIPATAFAKLSMRLVAGQDPRRILEIVQSYITQNLPDGIRAEFVGREVGGAALTLRSDSSVLELARKVSHEVFGVAPACLWEGASIPIIPRLAEAAGAEPLLVGFGMDEDNIHSPNESFSLTQFEEGFKFISGLLRAL